VTQGAGQTLKKSAQIFFYDKKNNENWKIQIKRWKKLGLAYLQNFSVSLLLYQSHPLIPNITSTFSFFFLTF